MERPGIAEILDSLAAVAGHRGDPRTGALLIGAADGVRAVGGSARQPDEEVWLAPIEAELREALGDDGLRGRARRGRGAGPRRGAGPGLRAVAQRTLMSTRMPAASWSGSEQ